MLTTDAIAWPAVSPMPIRLLPIVQDERQTPHVPIRRQICCCEKSAEDHTPIANKSVNTICTFVVGDGIDIPIPPSSSANAFVFIIGRLHLKAFDQRGKSHLEKV